MASSVRSTCYVDPGSAPAASRLPLLTAVQRASVRPSDEHDTQV